LLTDDSMNITRIFASADAFQPNDGEPLRTVIAESAAAVIVAWHLNPGQSIAAHIHPQGQDTWTILSGAGDYQLDALGTCQPIGAGDVVVAPIGAVHGVVNSGDEPLMFISVVSPGNAGYELLGV
jgi:quercetin dioxygenase-like cupin family protein